MASTLPHTSSDKGQLSFVPPQKRCRTSSGKSSTFTPSRSGPSRSVIYGDQILNVQGRTPSTPDQRENGSERDVLGSLEKLGGHQGGTAGTIRSIRSNGSITTLERVRREESNHSIGSHSQTSSGQLSERSTDIDLVREAVHQKRSLRSQGNNAGQKLQGSRSGSVHTSTSELDRISVVNTEERKKNIQARPLPNIPQNELPDLPETENQPKLQLRINANDEAIEILNTTENDIEPIGGHGIVMSLRHENESSNERSLLVKDTTSHYPGFLTVTGTIKRGKEKGECFDVKLKMDKNSLTKLEKELKEDTGRGCLCGLNRGLHILIASLILTPFLWLFCSMYAFYLGTLTWYNVFILYNEHRSCCHTVFISPCVLLVYPVWIFPVTLFLGLYGGFSQISWNWTKWRKELTDPEKGFFGWFCNKLSLPDCSPYQVVILTAPVEEGDPSTLTSVI